MALPPGGSTCADPPPESIPTSACPPMIAKVVNFWRHYRKHRGVVLQENNAFLFDRL